MKQRHTLAAVFLILQLVLSGCGGSGTETEPGEIVKPVGVMELKEETHPVTVQYTGTIEPTEVKKYSFKTGGRIAAVFVEEGESVGRGDQLALLEQEENAVTELDVEKARANYDFVKAYHDKVKKLHEAGAVSQQDLEDAALQLEQAEYSLGQAQKILEIKRSNALIRADSAGYVLKVISRENEVTEAGSPVVIIGSREFEGRIGLIEEDVSKVKAGDKVKVSVHGQETEGTVTTINKVPDAETRTYMADIALGNDPELNLGAIIKVSINSGTETGIWVPVQYILNDGEDHVFVMEKGRASRRNVTLGRVLEEKVSVEGLQEGELLITEGLKSVKDGYRVRLVGGTDTAGQ